MKLPQRHPNHILETMSWKILQAALPSTWILREVTERDYGIDAYLELVTNDGFVTGDLVSLQLKGVGRIEWKDRAYQFSGTRVETINYWMKLPAPVFLCIADAETGRVWFADVKDQVRRAYKEFNSQKTLTFLVQNDHTFNTHDGLLSFLMAYLQEWRHQRFSMDVMALLANCSQYAQFCEDRYHRDWHLPLEADNLMRLAHLHNVASNVASHLGVEWNLPSVEKLMGIDRQAIKDSSCDLHEGTALEFVNNIRLKLADIIVAARKHVAQDYADYWRVTDPLLFRACSEYSEFSYVIDQGLATLSDPK